MPTLAVPIYLNQRIAFDLLAILEDGFSQLQTVQTARKHSSSSDSGIGAEIGASNIFAFLGIRLSGEMKEQKQAAEDRVATEERVHTPASLYAKLYDRLVSDKQVVQVQSPSDLISVRPGNFVEFKGRLKKNPLVHLLDMVGQFGQMVSIFEEAGPESHSKKKDQGRQRIAGRGSSPTGTVLKQISAMGEELRTGQTVDLVCDVEPDSGIRAVVPVYQAYFFNQTMSEVIDGEYRVLGKVTRVVANPGHGEINLLRHTSFSLLPRQMIELMALQLRGLQQEGLQVGDLTTIVPAPALQVIPIAIFV